MDEQLLSGRRVLVIEDEMLVLMAIEDMMTDLGCTSITVAATLEKALHLVATQTYDLATLDVNLNGQRSDPIARALSAKGVPFAFSTGYGGHGINQGFASHPVLNKPYNFVRLVNVLTALLDAGAPPAVAV